MRSGPRDWKSRAAESLHRMGLGWSSKALLCGMAAKRPGRLPKRGRGEQSARKIGVLLLALPDTNRFAGERHDGQQSCERSDAEEHDFPGKEPYER